MAEQFAAPPINPLISITPLSTAAANRDATGVPAQLANAAPGSLVEGFVINRDPQGNPVLRTVLGDLMIKSDVFIKTGSEVVFRVDPTQTSHARILTIDGMKPQDYAAAQTRGTGGDTISQLAQLGGSQQAGLGAKAPAGTLQAILVSTTPLPASTIAANPLLAATLSASNPIPAGLLKLQQGAQLEIKMLQVALPEKLLTSGAPAVTQQKQAAALPPQPASPAAVPTQQPRMEGAQTMANANTARTAMQQTLAPTALPEGPLLSPALAVAQTKVQLASHMLPLPGDAPDKKSSTESRAVTPEKPNAPATPAKVTGIAASVIGHEKDGAMIIQSAVGTLKMHSPQTLPVGTAVRLQITPSTTPSPANIAQLSQEPVQPMTALAQEWPALDAALQLLQASDPAAAQSLTRAVPEIGSKLTSGMLFFIAAVKGGDLRQWIGGRAIAALEAKSPGIAGRLKSDMLQLQQMLTDSPLQNWNSVMVPMLYQGQLEQARLFFREDPDGGKQGSQGKDQRFIVEVDLSHLGDMQFDGFIRSGQKAKQFDLIVRSAAPLPADLTEQIRGTFDNAMQTTGIKGYLAFQPGRQHFVRPLANAQPSGSNGDSQPILA